jgi:hypothetical protein
MGKISLLTFLFIGLPDCPEIAAPQIHLEYSMSALAIMRESRQKGIVPYFPFQSRPGEGIGIRRIELRHANR